MKKILICIVSFVVVNAYADNCAGHKEEAVKIPPKKQKYFNKWDVDKNGSLTLEEYAETVKKEYTKKKKEGYQAEAEKRFKKKDTNQDGALSVQEFIASPKKKAKKPKATE